tara:strand:+ start:90 stop:713 length:624 start_codon:yes stop_codon:yes gene_type:complete
VKNKIPPATVKRLPIYLNCLGNIPKGKNRLSSTKLAELAKVNPAQVRRDLSYLGTLGTRGVGYEISTLRSQLRMELGLGQGWNAIIVGAGNLGTALAQYNGFEEKGFVVVGLYDTDEKKVSSKIAGLTVRSVDKIKEDCNNHPVAIGIIATPAEFAQETAMSLVDAGVKSILNFAPIRIDNIGHVQTRNVDLSQELQVLSYYLDRDL